MASLQDTTFSGGLVTANKIYPYGSGMSEWHRIYHCANADSTSECNPTYSCGWLHVRTPFPATNAASGIGWNPSILEVVGFHTYGGENTSDWMAITNNSGYADNAWFGSQVRVNDGTHQDAANQPYIYQSANTYGSYQRVCFSIRKSGCCCVGHLWVRYRNRGGSNYRTDSAWATKGMATQTAVAY
jgi:hypothetical protein